MKLARFYGSQGTCILGSVGKNDGLLCSHVNVNNMDITVSHCAKTYVMFTLLLQHKGM